MRLFAVAVGEQRSSLFTPNPHPPPGAPLSAYDVIVGNLIPTTLGNWVGGSFFVGTVYAFAYGTPNAKITAWMNRITRPKSLQ